ncbi:MAG: cysteine desulfurase [Verrucomicrobiota bacterium]
MKNDSSDSGAGTEPVFDIQAIRSDFPVLKREIEGRPLVYLDNAATAQKPRAVIDTVTRFYEEENANIHRGVHYLSMKATDAYGEARARIATALNVDTREIVFVRGATEAINLVAQSFLAPRLKPGDEILVTVMEHHANLVPWQLIAEPTGAHIKAVPIDENGDLSVEAAESLLTEKTKMFAFTSVSNALGTVTPARRLTAMARERGIPVLVDGAQAVPHGPVDLKKLDADFFVFSGHKVFGPDGIGVLHAKAEHLESMAPYQGGGGMIETVSIERSTYCPYPECFEAGTPNISGAIGLARAFDYLDSVGWPAIARQEQRLLKAATEKLKEIDGLSVIGTAPKKEGVLSFTMEGAHPHDIGTILDADGIAIRAGHHCTQPLMHHLGINSTARASFAFYNTLEEVEALVISLEKVRRFFP